MIGSVLIIADRFLEHRTSAHVVAQKIRRSGGNCQILSRRDLLRQSNAISFVFRGGSCQLHFRIWRQYIRLPQDIRSVFYWRLARYSDIDELKQLSEEEARFFRNEWDAFLRGVYLTLSDRFWVNPYPFNSVCEEKAYQLQLAQQIGFVVPKTYMGTSLQEAWGIFKASGDALIYKPFSQGTFTRKDEKGQSISCLLYTSRIRKSDLLKYQPEHTTPVIIQEYIPKAKEIRVTVVGKQVFAAEVDSQKDEESRVDWRKGIYHLPFVAHQLPTSISKRCFSLMRKLHLNYCTIDLILTPDDRYVFLELNPNGQYGWIEEMTHQPITKSIARMLLEGRIDYDPVT